MRSITLILAVLFYSSFGYANSDSVCGQSYDQTIPIVEVLSESTRDDVIQVRLSDRESGILAWSITYDSPDVGTDFTRTFTFVDDLFVRSLTQIPNLVGNQPEYAGLELEQTLTLKGISKTEMTNIRIQTIDACGFLSDVFELN